MPTFTAEREAAVRSTVYKTATLVEETREKYRLLLLLHTASASPWPPIEEARVSRLVENHVGEVAVGLLEWRAKMAVPALFISACIPNTVVADVMFDTHEYHWLPTESGTLLGVGMATDAATYKEQGKNSCEGEGDRVRSERGERRVRRERGERRVRREK